MSGAEVFLVTTALMAGGNAYYEARGQKSALQQQAFQQDIQANENQIQRLRQARARMAAQNVMIAAHGGNKMGSHHRRFFSASERALKDIDRARMAESGDIYRRQASGIKPFRTFLLTAGAAYGGGKIAAGGLDGLFSAAADAPRHGGSVYAKTYVPRR